MLIRNPIQTFVVLRNYKTLEINIIQYKPSKQFFSKSKVWMLYYCDFRMRTKRFSLVFHHFPNFTTHLVKYAGADAEQGGFFYP